MKEAFHQWLDQLPTVPGVYACGVRFADRSALSRSWSGEFTEAALENAWRCLADTLDVLRVNQLPEDRLRWVFARAILYGERRPDGILFGLFTARDPQGCDVSRLQQMVADFYAVA